jgi:hypothetical protein
MKDYKIQDNRVLVGDFDHEGYWREVRDEEKLDLLMQMMVDLHNRLDRLRNL